MNASAPSPLRCLLISDFNVESLVGYLANEPRLPAVRAEVNSFGQVLPTLLDALASVWSQPVDAVVVWTRPEGVIESFAAVQEGRDFDLDTLLAEVDAYAQALLSLENRALTVLVPSWVLPGSVRGLGLLDYKPSGIAATLAQMNLRLARNLAEAANFYVLDAGRWLQQIGPSASAPQLWYMGKIPFAPALFKLAAAEIKAALAAVTGRTKKLIVLDLDDTLWGGIVGDVGWEHVQLGGHDPVGEALVDFQRGLKALQRRGVLLAIVSKNDEATALEAIRQHPAMILREADFAGWRINWQDKAANLLELVQELNLGLDSVVYLDDSKAERERIRETLPEVLVPDWPVEKTLYPQALARLDCFDTAALTQEDSARTGTYVAERERRQLRESIGSVEAWLDKLELRVEIEPLGESNLKRAAQLLNKTNQMNLSTRRMTESEFARWAAENQRQVRCFHVADRFGEYGLTGLVSVEWSGDQGAIVDFILSCRVFGRKIENLMTSHAVDFLASRGVKQVQAAYLPTPKNKVTLDFWQTSGFTGDASNIFRWDTSRPYPAAPAFIAVTEHGG